MSLPVPQPIDDDEAFLTGAVANISVSSPSKAITLEELNRLARQQQDRVFANEEIIRLSYRKLECGKQSIADFRQTISALGLRETRALRKVLRETEQGATATYSKFIKALTMPDNSDPREAMTDSPGRRIAKAPPSRNTIPTLEDEYEALNRKHTPSKKVKPDYTLDSDVLTWSTPKKASDTPGGKRKNGSTDRMAATDAIPTLAPPPSPFKGGASSPGALAQAMSPATAQNELIKSYLADSITGSEFKELLVASGVGTSDTLERIIERKAAGGRARFTDIKKELVYLTNNPQYKKVPRTPKSKSSLVATVNIFSLGNEEPEKSPARKAPHSREQCDELRSQKDVLTWDNSPDVKFVSGKRVGSRDKQRDVIKWTEGGEQSPPSAVSNSGIAGGPAAASPSRAPKVGGRVNQTSANIFTMGQPVPSPKKAATAGSVPWGTMDDLRSDINPHLANLSKRT